MCRPRPCRQTPGAAERGGQGWKEAAWRGRDAGKHLLGRQQKHTGVCGARLSSLQLLVPRALLLQDYLYFSLGGGGGGKSKKQNTCFQQR